MKLSTISNYKSLTLFLTTARGQKGSNFAAHSQGNLLEYRGIQYQQKKGLKDKDEAFKSRAYFVNPNAPKDEQEAGIPTFAGYGSPVNTKDMGDTLKSVGFDHRGMVTHPNDFVAEGLGGNKGKNEQMSTSGGVKSIVDAPKLFTDDSPHSTYKCSENKNAICGDRP